MPVQFYELLEDPLDVDKKKNIRKYKKEADPLQKLSNGTITENENEDQDDNNTAKMNGSSKQITENTRQKHFRKGIREEGKDGADGEEGETSSFGSKEIDDLKVILKADSIPVGSELGDRSALGVPDSRLRQGRMQLKKPKFSATQQDWDRFGLKEREMNERGSQVSEKDYEKQFRIERRSIANASVTDLKNKLEIQQMQTENQLQMILGTQRGGAVKSQLSMNPQRMPQGENNAEIMPPSSRADYDDRRNTLSLEEQQLLQKLQKLNMKKQKLNEQFYTLDNRVQNNQVRTESFSLPRAPQEPAAQKSKKENGSQAMKQVSQRARSKEASPHNEDYFDNIKRQIESIKRLDESRPEQLDKKDRQPLSGRNDKHALTVMKHNTEYGQQPGKSTSSRKLNLTQQVGGAFMNFNRNNQFDISGRSNLSGAGLKSTLTNKRIGGLARRQIARQYTQEQDDVSSMFRNQFDIGKNTGGSFFKHQQLGQYGGSQLPANLNKNFNDIIMSQENLKQHILDQFEKKEVDQIKFMQAQEHELDLLRSQREQMTSIQDQLRSHVRELMTIKKRKKEEARSARREASAQRQNETEHPPHPQVESRRGPVSSAQSKSIPSIKAIDESPLQETDLRKSKIQKQKNEILNKIQDALRRSFERKQEQIKANLEQITAIEKELQEAKQINQDQQKEMDEEMEEAAGQKKKRKKQKYRREADGGVATQTQSQWPKPGGRNSQSDAHSSPSQSCFSKSQNQNEQGAGKHGRAHPAKQGMIHASQQLSQGNYQVENPHNKLGPKLMETLKQDHLGVPLQGEPQFVDQALDPMVRDQALDCMVRDMATDPLANEKGTDPKMKDTATDAWKRDGVMQTLKKSHQGSLQIAQEKIIIPTVEKEKLRQKEEDEKKAKAEEERKKQEEKEKAEQLQRQDQKKEAAPATLASSKKKKSKAKSNSPQKHGGTQYDLDEMAHGGKGIKDQKHNSTVLSEEEEDAFDTSFERSNADVAKKLQDLPIYHDHLIDDIMNQKLNKLNSINNNSKLLSHKRNSDSRSTQQAFESSVLGYKLNQNRLKDHRLTIQPSLHSNQNQSNVKIQDSNQQQNYTPAGGVNQQFQSPHQQNLPPIGSEFLTPKMHQLNQSSGQQNVIGSPAPTVVRNQQSLLFQGNMTEQSAVGTEQKQKGAGARRFNLDQQPQPIHQNYGHGYVNQQPGFHGIQQQQMMGQQHRGQQSLPPVANQNYGGPQQAYQQNQQMYSNQGQHPYAGNMGLPRGSGHPVVQDGAMYMGQGNSVQGSLGQFNQPNQLNMSIQRASVNGHADPHQQLPPYGMQMLNSQRDPNNSQERLFARGPAGIAAENTLINQSIQHLPHIGGGPTSTSYPQSQHQSNAMLQQMQNPAAGAASASNYIDLNQQAYKGIGGNVSTERKKPSHPLKYFKGQDLEMYYMEKQLKPEVEREIKKGFFEIRKKFKIGDTAEPSRRRGDDKEEEVQVYVSHVSLHDFHPIFCKFAMDTVKTILNFSSIVYLNEGQTLYAPGFNDTFFYIILFGKLNLFNVESKIQIGQQLTIGWTVGEEILFKPEKDEHGQLTAKQIRREICKAAVESCVLGIDRKNLIQIKKTIYDKNREDEFTKFEIVLRGNHLVKKDWK